MTPTSNVTSNVTNDASHPSGTPAPRPRRARLSVPDLVTIGVFTALYFVCVTVATFACAVVAGFGSVFLPAVAALVSGPVFMLMVARIGRFGGITVMGAVLGLFLFVSGHFILSFVTSLVFPVLADLVARLGRYRNRALLLVSYVVFGYGLTGPILPLWFMKDAYVASLEARGKDAAYIADLFAPIDAGSFVAAMAAIAVCGVLGGWFGLRLCAKHFAKAGLVR